MLKKYGPNYFSFQDIWQVDWDKLLIYAKEAGKIPQDYFLLSKRNTFVSRVFHFYMRMTIDIRFLRYISDLR
jgi:hypothetical protein